MSARKFIPVGTRFNRLVVLDSFPDDSKFPVQIVCRVRCDCGTEKIVRTTYLLSGRTGSCGCWRADQCSKSFTSHGKTGTPEHKTWVGMIGRCHVPANNAFEGYGGKGISVCTRWRESFEAFFEDMGPKPKGHTIDRINSSGNYEPGNCRWATQTEQSRNRRQPLADRQRANPVRCRLV